MAQEQITRAKVLDAIREFGYGDLRESTVLNPVDLVCLARAMEESTGWYLINNLVDVNNIGDLVDLIFRQMGIEPPPAGLPTEAAIPVYGNEISK